MVDRTLKPTSFRGFVAGAPKNGSALKWYSSNNVPQAFAEEATHPALSDLRVQKGDDWEIAFYRSPS